MRVEKLTTHIGAELSGVSLAEAVSNDDLFGEIRQALLDHKVLFLRDQELSKAEHEHADELDQSSDLHGLRADRRCGGNDLWNGIYR